MPFYEFFSPDTNKIYTFLARSLAQRNLTPRCPDGASHRMERRVSSFSITGRHKEDKGDDPFSGLDETQVENLMQDMEREMEGMDDTHPDPKHLGRMMRKLTDLMGDRTPEALREMVLKLEAGEDPEKLEEQLGDIPHPDSPEDSMEPNSNDDLWAAVRKKLSSYRRPARDPKLYELSDWL
jgi:hypothetical protein